MTREKEMAKVSREEKTLGEMMAFRKGVEWADEHPRWISVEDEMPKEHEWILGFSLKRSYIDVYNFDSNGLIEAHSITHWMRLSPPPIIISSKKGDEE